MAESRNFLYQVVLLEHHELAELGGTHLHDRATPLPASPRKRGEEKNWAAKACPRWRLASPETRGGDRSSYEVHQLLDVRVKIFPARDGTSAASLNLGTFQLDLQRVHEAVHQAAKRCDGREFHDLGAVEVFGELRVCGVVIARLIPRHELGPADDRFLALAEKRAFEIAVAAERIELLLGPACGSPDQAIVLDSVPALVQRRDFDHRQRTGPGVELAAKAVLLEHRLERQQELHDRR